MVDLLSQKNTLLAQLHHYVNTFGLNHPSTVRKSQELDAIITKIVFQDIKMKKRAS